MKKERNKHFTFNGEPLHSAPLSSSAVSWKGEAVDASTCSDTGAQNIVRVQIITPLDEINTHIIFSGLL